MGQTYRGVWKVTDDGHILSEFGPKYSLFVDGIKRASCSLNVKFDYAMAWYQPSGDYIMSAERAIQCLNLRYAEAKCLEFAGLSPDEVDRSAFEIGAVPDAFVKAFGKE